MDQAFHGAQSFVIGSSHIVSNTPCQDFADWGLINDSSALSVLSDGAGSAPHSDIGSKAICEATIECLTTNSPWKLSDEGLSLLLIGYIRTQLSAIAKIKEIKLSDLAGTLLIAITRVTDQNLEYKLIQLGDGVGACVHGNESIEISIPENGEFANETYFVTSSKALSKLKITTGVAPLGSSFILMSDGSAASLYQKSTQSLAPACYDMVSWLQDNDSETVNEALKYSLRDFISKQTSDDCSVAILSHKAHTDGNLLSVNDSEKRLATDQSKISTLLKNQPLGLFSNKLKTALLTLGSATVASVIVYLVIQQSEILPLLKDLDYTSSELESAKLLIDENVASTKQLEINLATAQKENLQFQKNLETQTEEIRSLNGTIDKLKLQASKLKKLPTQPQTTKGTVPLNEE